MERQQAHIQWVLQLRWVAAACFLTLLAVVGGLYDWWLPTGALLALLGLLALSAGGLQVWSRRQGGIREPILAAVLLADIGTLTALLALSNGPLNPFTSLYFLYVAVAAVALSPLWVTVVVGVSIGAYGWLYLLHPGTSAEHLVHAHAHHQEQGQEQMLQLHLAGMWIAYAFTAPFLALSLHLVRRSLSRYEVRLTQAQKDAEQARKLAALATLAAGAAHELATPLATITVAARELEHRLRHDADAAEDTHLIRAEVERCSAILRQLAADAGEGRGEALQPVRLSDLLASLAEGFPAHIELEPALAGQSLPLPRDLLTRALRGLVKNAAQASPPQTPIRLRLRAEDALLLLEIIDLGAGIPDDVRERLGEPFFTTRPPGQGMGLGVFFARETLHRLGGALSYPPPEPGQIGTIARIRLPSPPTRRRHA